MADEFRDEGQASALERETADFIRACNVELPGLRVWSVTREAFLEHARQHGLLHLTLDIEGAAAIARSFGESRDRQALKAHDRLDAVDSVERSASSPVSGQTACAVLADQGIFLRIVRGRRL
jgi:hypothetical protein